MFTSGAHQSFNNSLQPTSSLSRRSGCVLPIVDVDKKNNLRERALSERTGTVCSAMVEMIRGKQFLFSEPDISGLAKRGDEIIDGWIFAYRLYGLPPQERNDLLRTNIKSENPRIREQVCDIIGDEFIEELREPLLELIDDPVDYVSNAARYNHDEMFNAYQGVCSDPPPRCSGGPHSSAI
jgi:hypothetical protein